jgi:hypothetical protein
MGTASANPQISSSNGSRTSITAGAGSGGRAGSPADLLGERIVRLELFEDHRTRDTGGGVAPRLSHEFPASRPCRARSRRRSPGCAGRSPARAFWRSRSSIASLSFWIAGSMRRWRPDCTSIRPRSGGRTLHMSVNRHLAGTKRLPPTVRIPDLNYRCTSLLIERAIGSQRRLEDRQLPWD